METITIAQSFLRNGLWQAADWRAQVVNEETGEILLTAVCGDNQEMIGVRLTTEIVRQLRELTAFASANMRRDDEENRYDCRTTEQRLAEVWRRIEVLDKAIGQAGLNHQWQIKSEQVAAERTTGLAKRVEALERAIAQEITLRRETDDRLAATQQRLMETERDLAQAELALRKRVEYLERHAQGITGPDAERGA